jgi:MFS family permease
MISLVLAAFGVNRLILAGLSASLPLLVAKDEQVRERLVAINATAVTGGTVFVVLGGGVGIGIRNLMADVSANHADSLVIFVAGAIFFLTALLALLFRREELGPEHHEMKKASFFAGIDEMRDGFKRLQACRDAMLGIIATGVHRSGLTALTLMALILQRNSFNSSSEPSAGLAGFALAAVVAGVGIAVGALIAPFGVARFGRHRWIRWMLISSAIAPFFLALEQSEPILLLTGFLTGACGQGVKVTNDALVQSQIVDQYRGRVFAVYDVMVNSAIVSGALVAALLLPKNGAGGLLPLVVSVSYLVVAAVLLRPKYFHSTATR